MGIESFKVEVDVQITILMLKEKTDNIYAYYMT